MHETMKSLSFKYKIVPYADNKWAPKAAFDMYRTDGDYPIFNSNR